jgi:hypothetical protein
MNKYTYNSLLKQVKNHLFIDTTEGEIDIVFIMKYPTNSDNLQRPISVEGCRLMAT